MLRSLVVAALLACGLAPAVAAQNRGQDDAKFELTEFEKFGEYELFCGHFGDPKAEKCELRRTDILNPRPRFRAMVIFWRFDADGLRVTVDAERTTTWVGGGIKIDGERVIWFDRCIFGRCIVEGEQAKDLLARLDTAKALSLAFTDIAEAKDYDWDLADLKAGLAKIAQLRKAKGLP
jgi:invasion protein IalB